MWYRRTIFKSFFQREHFAMKLYYNTNSKKNKHFKEVGKKFDGLIDE